jgi:SNF2 family DNA or RNA helicase
MIFKSAIRRWLDRPLQSLADWKAGVLEHGPDAIIRAKYPKARFTTPPYEHQKVGFIAGQVFPSLMLFWGMGLGKTKTVFDIVDYLLRTKQAKRVLIQVPTVVTVQSWLDEADIHAPQLDVQPLAPGVLEGKAQIVVATYQGWLAAVADKGGKARKVNGRDRKWHLGKQAQQLSRLFDVAVWDECTSLKSSKSLYFEAAKLMMGCAKHRYGLTGTPFGRDLQDLWSQFYVLDRGESFGSFLGLYREACFRKVKDYWGGVTWNFRKSCKPDVRRFIDNRALRFEEEECIDLPEQTYQTTKVALPEEAVEYYDRMLREFRAVKGDLTVMKNAFVTMRQLTSGYLCARNPDTDERMYSDFEQNPKLAALLEIIDAVPPGKKLVIFHDYIHTGEIVEAALRKRFVDPPARIYSKTRDKAGELRRFQTDAACWLAVLNSKSCALGLNLQVANYVVFYECPVEPIVRQQAEKRCHRTGQTGIVHYFDLVCRHTVDVKLLRYCREGQDLFDALVRGKAKL